MARLSQLGIVIDATGARRGARDVQNALQDIGTSARKTANDLRRDLVVDARPAQQGARQVVGAMDGIESSAKRAAREVQKAASVIGIALGVRQLIDYADTFKQIEARIALVSRSSADLARAQESLFSIAQASRQAFSDVAELYIRMGRSAADLGADQQSLLEVTEAVGLALRVSGTTSTQAAGALLQLSQALGAGTVRAEELNSILEGAPRIAQAAAQQLGLSIAQLRARVLEGNLTSAQLFDALRGSLDQLRSEASTLPSTVGGALAQLNNSLGALVSGADGAVGATEVLAQSISRMARFLDENRAAVEALTVALGAGGLALAARQAALSLAALSAAQTAGAFISLIRYVTGLKDILTLASFAATGLWRALTGPIGLAITGIGLLTAWIYRSRDAAQDARKSMTEYIASVSGFDANKLSVEVGKTVLAIQNLTRAQQEQGPSTLIVDRRNVAEALEREKAKLEQLLPLYRQATAARATSGQAATAESSTALARLNQQLAEAQGQLTAYRQGGTRLAEAMKLAGDAWKDASGSVGTFDQALQSGNASARTALTTALGIVDAKRRYAAATEASTRSTKAEDEAQKRSAEVARDAAAAWVQLGIELAQRQQERREFVTELEASSRASQRALAEEIAAAKAGALALRQLQLVRAGEVAAQQAVTEAKSRGITLTAEEIALVRADATERERLVRVLAAIVEWQERLARGENPFVIVAQDTQRWGGALESVVDTLRDLSGVLNGTGNDAVKMLGILTSALEGLARAQQRAKDAAKAGQSVSTTQAVAAGVGGVVGSFGAGVAVGSSTSSRTVGALGGAAAGAATGAAAGSVVPGLGTVVGGVIGGLVGAIGGVLGASKNATQELIAQRSAQEQLNEALTALRASFAGDPLGAAIAQARAQFDQLRQQTEAAFSGKKNESERNRVLAELNTLEAQRVLLLQQQYAETMRLAMGDLDARRMRALGQETEAARLAEQLAQQREINEATRQFGADSPYVAALREVQAAEQAAAEATRLRAEAERAFTVAMNAREIGIREAALRGEDTTAARLRLDGDRELEQARKLVESGELTAEMFERLAAVIEGEVANAIRAAEEAAAQAAAALRDDLAVRTLLAQGKDAEAAALRREIAWRAELVGITDAALLAQLEYVQQLEKEALVKAELEAAAERAIALEQQRLAQNQSIDVRMLRAQGREEDASALEQQIARERELREAVDESTRARLRELFAMEDAAAAAAKAAEALKEQARQAERLAGLTFDLNIDLLEAEGNTFEAQRQRIIQRGEQRRRELIENGASADVLANLDRLIQRQLDNLIRSTIETATEAIRETTSRDAASSGTMAYNRTGVQTLSEGTGMRLVDVALSQLITLRSIDRKVGGASAGGVTVQVSVAGFVAGTPQQLGREIAQAVAPLVDESLGRRVGVDRRLTGTVGL